MIMNDEINYKANPLHGLSLKKLLIDLEGHYGFDILFAYLNINCFKINPSIDSSAKFLKKTDWAREKVEAFYLYEFKNFPKASSEQFKLPPRERLVSEIQTPREPAKLSLEDAQILNEKRAKKAANYSPDSGKNYGAKRNSQHSNNRNNDDIRNDVRKSSNSSNTRVETDVDPWGKWIK